MHRITLFVLIAVLAAATCLANPFTQKPASPPEPPAGAVQPGDTGAARPGILMKITLLQQRIKVKMTGLIREAKATGRLMPLVLVLGSAMIYGMVHSAGPGHGKALALSYIFGFKPGPARALAFGNLLAFSHGMSGFILVLGVKYIFEASVSASLASVTQVTQIASYSLITLLGCVLFVRPILAKPWEKPAGSGEQPSVESRRRPALWSALAMGMIPCPGVVLAMLFCLSMGLPLFGVLVGLAISTGMALTLSAIVLAAVLGKSALLYALPGNRAWAAAAETAVEALAGLILAGLGLLLLMAAL